jgi:hypothetical protein
VTTIRLGVLHPTGATDDARSLGVLEFVATARRVVDGDVVLPAPFSVTLSATEDVTRELAPTTSEWVWKVLERVTGGANGWRYLAVPDSLTPLDYAALAEVDLATLDPVAVPEAAWWAALAGRFLVADLAHPGLYSISSGPLTPDPANPGLYLMGI